MLKLLYTIAFLSVALIAVTIYLVKLNWSEKVYLPLFYILLAGTVTTLITVLALLKESHIQDAFVTYVVLDTAERAPLFFATPYPNDAKRNLRLMGLASVARHQIDKDGNTERVIPGPADDSEAFRYCGELLQYEIFQTIHTIQHVGRQSTQVGQYVTAAVRIPSQVSRTTVYTGQELLTFLSANRFGTSPFERSVWEIHRLRLPEKTSVQLFYEPSSAASGPEKHVVRLVKPDFFQIDIAVSAIGATAHGVVPRGLQAPPEKRASLRTFEYEVNLHARFEKLTAGNWQTDELKTWTEWLFKELRAAIAD